MLEWKKSGESRLPDSQVDAPSNDYKLVREVSSWDWDLICNAARMQLVEDAT